MPGSARRPARGSGPGRVVALLLPPLAELLRRLPEGPLHRMAHLTGAALFIVLRERRSLARANLRRVCAHLAASGLASSRVARASRDERALDQLVRDAFGHWVRGYLEALLVPGYSERALHERITIETPELVAEALEPGPRGRVLIGLHFGSIELPALYAVRAAGLSVTTPMETIADPALQRAILRARAATGVRIVPAESAGPELTAELRAGGAIALVADRDIGHSGIPVTLFGAPARLPLGPAVLAVAFSTPAYVVGVRRSSYGRYAARMERIALPPDGPRRARVREFLDAEARAFERLIADAPEQWWTVLFPIWEDLTQREHTRTS